MRITVHTFHALKTYYPTCSQNILNPTLLNFETQLSDFEPSPFLYIEFFHAKIDLTSKRSVKKCRKTDISQFEEELQIHLVGHFFLNLCSITNIILSTDPSNAQIR